MLDSVYISHVSYNLKSESEKLNTSLSTLKDHMVNQICSLVILILTFMELVKETF